ncbi:hypothetical protein C9374_014531 [Naegleria lovaniensis]|uniref:PUB domain-containing protein n=1 Tax=Naegleria lovaniensis TaxID=51637 RepID=A0AA88GVF5_NAELO|nr:uncharacterized protein C9374_014531 [Naegleria lovaniensis]KAG2389131.1 hypothetical protein C9374_014531 [Naegleria lovaniensis]
MIKKQAQHWIHSNHQHFTPSTLHVLHSICHNIITHPHESKFRSIKMENPKFKENVLNVEGAMDLLYLVGFEQDPIEHTIFYRCNGKEDEDLMVKDLTELCQALEEANPSDQPFSLSPRQLVSPISHHHETTPSTSMSHSPFQSVESTRASQPHTTFSSHPPLPSSHISQPLTSTAHDEEYEKKQRELEERRKQLAEEKRIKREEAQRIKNQAKLDRKEKHDEDEYEHELGVTAHSHLHNPQQGNPSGHNPFYSGMTTFKDIGNQ